LHNPSANRKQESSPEAIYQTPLTNKKQVNLDLVHGANIIKPTQTHINREKYTFCVIKSLEQLNKFKNWLCPLLRPRSDHACPQKQNPYRETVPLNVEADFVWRENLLL
jgi:hypothetical protein